MNPDGQRKIERADGGSTWTADDGFDHVDRRLRTLRDCALHRRTIRLDCPACGRTVRLDAVPLWWWFARRGADDGLPGAWRRLRCGECLERDGRTVRPRATIVRDAPDRSALPYPDRSTWRRLVSRYRS